MSDAPLPKRRSRIRYLLFALLALAPSLIVAVIFGDVFYAWYEMRMQTRRDVGEAVDAVTATGRLSLP